MVVGRLSYLVKYFPNINIDDVCLYLQEQEYNVSFDPIINLAVIPVFLFTIFFLCHLPVINSC